MYKNVILLGAVLLLLSACVTAEAMFGKSGGQAATTASIEQQTTSQAQQQPTMLQRALAANKKLTAERNALSSELEMANAHIAQLKHKTGKSPQQPLIGNADVDVYLSHVNDREHERIYIALKKKGFSPKYPALPNGMSMARSTTVFYYDAEFISTAGVLAQELAKALNGQVTVKKGASAFNKNKLVVQIRG